MRRLLALSYLWSCVVSVKQSFHLRLCFLCKGETEKCCVFFLFFFYSVHGGVSRALFCSLTLGKRFIEDLNSVCAEHVCFTAHKLSYIQSSSMCKKPLKEYTLPLGITGQCLTNLSWTLVEPHLGQCKYSNYCIEHAFILLKRKKGRMAFVQNTALVESKTLFLKLFYFAVFYFPFIPPQTSPVSCNKICSNNCNVH